MQSASGDYVLTLENTIDRSRMSVVPSHVAERALDYETTIIMADLLPAGEYSYEFRQGAAVLAVGILTAGEYEYDTTQYEAGTNYEQYQG